MKTYILRWNPTFSSWKTETHKDVLKKTADGDTRYTNWSIYDFEDLEEGDFYILQQVGTENDGIAAFGTFLCEPYTEENWRKKDGTNLFYADIKFDFVLLRDKQNLIFSADELSSKFPQIDWHKGHSGVLIPEDIQEELILKIATTAFNQKKSTENIAFPDDCTLYQNLCDVINELCPNFKNELIKKQEMNYKNYKKGEMIDKDLVTIGFMYDKIKEANNITKETLIDYLYPEA